MDFLSIISKIQHMSKSKKMRNLMLVVMAIIFTTGFTKLILQMLIHFVLHKNFSKMLSLEIFKKLSNRKIELEKLNTESRAVILQIAT